MNYGIAFILASIGEIFLNIKSTYVAIMVVKAQPDLTNKKA